MTKFQFVKQCQNARRLAVNPTPSGPRSAPMLALVCMLLLILNSSAVFAAAGDQYLLPKLGFMTIDVEDTDSLLTAGCEYGYGLNQNISLEAEANYGFSGGTYKNLDKNIKGEFRIATIAAYGVYRVAWGQSAYLKLKGGVHFETIARKTEVFNSSLPPQEQIGDTSNTDTGFAGGLGVGGKLDNNLTMELELTGIDQKIRLLSLGLHYGF